ncbi:MAG: MobF family relaxase [Acidimicrobiia bacterium]
MGAGSVRYHEQVVLGRADDFPGQTLAYYGSRGETPMRWGGAGAKRLGLAGATDPADYHAVFATGGARDPILDKRLVSTKRPGMELVVSAHKSVAVLGVVDRADDMHQILDAETDATMAFLDAWVQRQGGRRGRLQVRTPTSGLVYGRTRHATSRAGDPNPHDHVLVANVVEMLDDTGGWKALDTAGVRDMVHAATAVGRLHAAWRARQLGYGIEADHGPSGKLDHWRIAGIPAEACELFSKRSDEIDDFAGDEASYRLRSRMARATRADKTDDQAPEQLMDRWHAELASIGLSPAQILDATAVAAPRRPPAERLTDAELAELVGWVLSPDGPLAGDKRFGRAEATRHLAPKLHGRHPDELERALGAALAHPEALPLLGQPGARNRSWVLASTRAAEEAIADTAERLAQATTAVSVDSDTAQQAIAKKQWDIGARLTDGQRRLVETAATSGRQLELVLGVAGAGKTTALDALRASFEASGHRVIGTATSGQAARTLGDAAHLESRTTTSLLWRLRHGHETLDRNTVLVIDEAGMVDDQTMLRLLTTADIHGAKVVVVGDHHQLGAVGPGGGLEALITRHPDAVHVLDDNVRQRDPAERFALEQLRAGDVTDAVSFYAGGGRIAHHDDRWDARLAMTAAWEADVDAGHDTTMLAWRRRDVAQLNHFARMRRRAAGEVGETSVEAPGGRRYSVGDRVVALAPAVDRRFVTSQRGTVTDIDLKRQAATIRFDGAEADVVLGGQQLDHEHLDHGYAVTVHRAQGATVDRAHVYVDGGGRELAYVAMSRARETTTVHCVAEDLDQAVEDLARDWSQDRRQRWTLDTDFPASQNQRTRPSLLRTAEVGLRLGRLRAERDAVLAAMPADPMEELAGLAVERRRLASELHELRTGTGRFEHTDTGQAARQLADADRNLDRAATAARSPKMSRRQRRRVEALVEDGRAEVDAAEQRWRRVGHELEQELLATIDDVDDVMSSLEPHRQVRAFWQLQHPAAAKRLEALDREIHALERQAGVTAPERAHRPPPAIGGLSR